MKSLIVSLLLLGAVPTFAGPGDIGSVGSSDKREVLVECFKTARSYGSDGKSFKKLDIVKGTNDYWGEPYLALVETIFDKQGHVLSTESLVTANINWANAYPGANFENEKVFGMGDAAGVLVLESSVSGSSKRQSLNRSSALYVDGVIVYKKHEIPIPGSKFLDKGSINVLKITCDK